MDLFDIAAKITLDTDDFDKKIKSTRTEATSFASHLKANLASEAIIGGVKAVGGAIHTVGSVLAGLAKEYVIEGGMARALNIEEAQFKLKGLGHDADSVSEIMDNALKSVKGTAFGLDEAVTTAAGAVAAGIQSGDDLTRYLKSVADMSAIAGTSMGDMGAIFNKVTSSGKAQNDVLRQLADRGIPIYQWLAEELEISAGKVAEFAADGKIDLETFREAVEEHVGGAALTMGETFSGAVSNAKAAASRLGAGFMGNLTKSLTPALGVLTSIIDDIAAGNTENIDVKIDELTSMLSTAITELLNNIKPIIEGLIPLVGEVIEALARELPSLIQTLLPIVINGATALFVAFIESLPELISLLIAEIPKAVTQIWNAIVKVLEEYAPELVEPLQTVADTVTGLFNWIIKNKEIVLAALAAILGGFVAYKVITGIINAVTVAQSALNAVMMMNPFILIATLIAALVAAIIYLWNTCEGFRNAVKKIWEAIKTAFIAAWEAIKVAWDAVVGFFVGIWEGIKGAFDSVVSFFTDTFNDAKEFAVATWDNATELWETVKTAITGVFEDIGTWFSDTFTSAKDLAVGAWDNATELFTTVKNAVTGAFDTVGTWFSDTFTSAKDLAVGAWDNATELFTTVKDNVTSAFDTVGTWFSDTFTEAKDFAVSAWDNAKEKFETVKTNITGVFDTIGTWFSEKFTEAKDSAVTAWDGIKETFSGVWTSIKEAFNLEEAWEWGKDMITEFWEGIKAGWEWLKTGVSNVAGSIKDFLGFSEPEKGPLSDFHTYAPDMMKLFAQGIKDNEKIVTDQLARSFNFGNNFAIPPIMGTTGGIVGGMGASNNNTVTINVYGHANQDVSELADEVSDRINAALMRREAVFG